MKRQKQYEEDRDEYKRHDNRKLNRPTRKVRDFKHQYEEKYA